MMTHISPEPDQQLKFRTLKNPRWQTAAILKNRKCSININVIDSLLKTGNTTANINVKKLPFIHTVNRKNQAVIISNF